MNIKNIILIGLTVLLASCATLFGRPSDEVSITTIPAGAKVYSGDKLLGVTPFKKVFDRDTFNHIHITVLKDGYDSQRFLMKKTIAKVAILNLTSVLSWGTDALSGNMMEYSPKSYLIELKKQGKHTEIENQHSQLVKFIAVNQARLFEEIAKGGGEVIDNMMLICNVEADKRAAAVSNLRADLKTLMNIQEPVALSMQVEKNLIF